jgi:hypothetical protein
MYADVLKTVFNCASVGATFHIENLRGISGEIRLRLGENEPFGVINVGDDSALLSDCVQRTASIPIPSIFPIRCSKALQSHIRPLICSSVQRNSPRDGTAGAFPQWD